MIVTSPSYRYDGQAAADINSAKCRLQELVASLTMPQLRKLVCTVFGGSYAACARFLQFGERELVVEMSAGEVSTWIALVEMLSAFADEKQIRKVITLSRSILEDANVGAPSPKHTTDQDVSLCLKQTA